MSSDREMTRIVRSWLEQGTSVLPDRVLDRVLDQLPATPQRRRRWWQAWRYPFMSNTLKVATAGAAALLVVVALGVYASLPDGMLGPPAASPSPTAEWVPSDSPVPTPVEIAAAYIAARNAHDPARARELLADNFTTTEPPDGYRDLSSLELAFENHRAWGFQHSLGDCRESEQAASPDIAVVECDSLWTTEVHLRGDIPPTPETFRFTIRDGRITRVVHSASDYDWYFGPRSFYDDFLSEHLEFRALVDRNHNLDPEATREVIELLPEYFELYERWLSGVDSSATPAPTPVSGMGSFQPGAHAMSTPREWHTATLLSDGRVLLIGGTEGPSDLGDPLDSAETYDPSTGALIATRSMTKPRLQHTATLLADGRVLVAGGATIDYWTVTASAEIYEPESDTFAPTGSMSSARKDHTATLLTDGRVLIAGGRGSEADASAEIYDPGNGTFVPTGSMVVVGRHGHTATLLPDGRVLIVGGRLEASAEIYDPASGTFSATGSMPGLRGDHTATLLADGRVLIVGGCSEAVHEGACLDFPFSNDVASSEIYDPASGTFTPTGRMAVERQRHSATLLADGRVLIAGGVHLTESTEILSAEIYDPGSGTFARAASMGAVRIGHIATLLPDGRVLFAGGRTEASVEVYRP